MATTDTTSNNATDPTPLLAREEGNMNDDDSEDAPHILLAKKEEEEKIPSSSHFVRDAKLTLWQFRVPLKVLGINILSLILVQALLTGGDNHNHYYGNSSSGYQNLQYQTMLRTGLIISFLTFLWNANLGWQGAQAMEQKLNQPRQDTPPSNNQEETQEFDYVQFSRRVDSTFGSTSTGSDGTARSSFLVCLLYALFSLAVWQSLETGTSFLQVQFMKTEDIPEKGKCFEQSIFSDTHYYYDEDDERGIGALQRDPNFKSLPLNVRTWISQQAESGRERIFIGGMNNKKKGGFNQSLPFLQLQGGDLVFTKARNRNNMYSALHRADNYKGGMAVFHPATRSVTQHTSTCNDVDVWSDGEIELIGFPAQPPYSAWCSVFQTSGSMILQDEVICYNEKSQMLHRFDCVKAKGSQWNGWGGVQYNFYTSPDNDNQFWVAYARNFQTRNQQSTKMATLMKYDIETMESQLVLNWNSTKRRNQGSSDMTLNPACTGYYWTNFAVSLTTLSLLAGYLYRLDVPSCTAPAALAVSTLVSALLHPAAAGVFLLVWACLCLYLLIAVKRSSAIWRYVSTSMLIWALYTLQIASSWVFWSPSFYDDNFYEAEVFFSFLPFPLLSCLVAAATNVLLNHPFFQVLAVCFGSLSVFSFVFALMGLNFLMIHSCWGYSSLGCFLCGYSSTMYRVHLIVHARRVCQKLRTLPAAAAAAL